MAVRCRLHWALRVLLIYIDQSTGFNIRLWPIDSQSCDAEVEVAAYAYKPCHTKSFREQPPDYPFHVMEFLPAVPSQDRLIETRVEMTQSFIDHIKIEAMVYPESPNGVIFKYISDENYKELSLELSNYKVKVHRKVSASLQETYTGTTVLTARTWHHVVVRNGGVGYIYTYVNGIKEFEGPIGKRTSVEVPGSLIIGGDSMTSTDDFHGRLSCVGFVYGDGTGTSSVDGLSKTTPWLPERGKNSLYFDLHANSTSTPVVIKSEITCSHIQCAYTCLQMTDCFYISYNDTTTGCNMCHMYYRKDDSLNTTQFLYKVKTSNTNT